MQSLTFSGNSLPLPLDTLQRMWAELNRTYFQDRLPPIHIRWSTRLTSTAGIFVSQHGPRSRWISPEERHGVGRVIRLSWPIHQRYSLSELRGTLAHEMIHQWQFDVKKCRPTHGREFRRLMKMMNRDGLDISVYHKLVPGEGELAPYAWLCVQCGRSYSRQRNTVSVQRHRCGNCHGRLRQIDSGKMFRAPDDRGARTSEPVPDPSVSTGVPIQLSFPFSE